MADVELRQDDLFHAEPTGAGGAGQQEHDRALTDRGFGAALYGAGADFGEGELAKELANPGMALLTRGARASGVTSRPVTPVPPVLTMASITGSAIQWRRPDAGWRDHPARYAGQQSGDRPRRPRLARVSPDLSVSGVRVSDTVRIPRLRGRKGRLLSIMSTSPGFSSARRRG